MCNRNYYLRSTFFSNFGQDAWFLKMDSTGDNNASYKLSVCSGENMKKGELKIQLIRVSQKQPKAL